MTTPAVDTLVARTGLSPGDNLRWWGEWQPTSFVTNVVDLQQKRPESKTAGKAPDGQWNRSAWQHYWFRSGGIPVGYSFTLADNNGRTIGGARSGSDSIVQVGPFSLSQVAPWLVVSPAGLPFEMFNLENATRTRLLNKLREENVDLGVALSEIGKTAGFVTSSCQAIWNSVERIRKTVKAPVRDLRYWLYNGFDKTPPWHRRKGPSAEKRVKAQADRARDLWLQHQFALKPLLSDIEESAKSLDKYVNGSMVPDTRVNVRAGSSTERYDAIQLRHSTYGGSFHYPVPVLVQSAVHGSVDYHIEPSWTRTFESLGLGNPAALVHELTAFSWMLDYVVAAGSWLASLSADRGATFLGGSLSYIQRLSTTSTTVSYKLTASGAIMSTISSPSLKLRLDVGRFERRILTGVFLPAMMPAVKNRMNLTRMANSIFALTKSYGPNLRI